jgi:hypothetical protein
MKIGSLEGFIIGNLELLNPYITLSWIGVWVWRLTRHMMKRMHYYKGLLLLPL